GTVIVDEGQSFSFHRGETGPDRHVQRGTAELVCPPHIQLVVAHAGRRTVQFHEVISLRGEVDVAARQDARAGAGSQVTEHLKVPNHAAADQSGSAVYR